MTRIDPRCWWRHPDVRSPADTHKIRMGQTFDGSRRVLPPGARPWHYLRGRFMPRRRLVVADKRVHWLYTTRLPWRPKPALSKRWQHATITAR